MGFRKVTRVQIDAQRVTLYLRKSEDGKCVGHVATLALNELSEEELMKMEFAEAELAEAIAFAIQLADFKEQDVDVYDPDSLWEDGFSHLS